MRRGDDLEFSEIPAIPSPYWGKREMEVRPGLGAQIRVVSFGEKSERGCLVGIQPAWESWQFRTELDFRAALFDLLSSARQAGFLEGKSCVVLPELVVLQLLLVDEFPWVTLSPTWQQALTTALGDEKAWRLVAALAKSKALGWDRAVALEVIQGKLHRALEAWVSSFSLAAQEFNTAIFAGTMLLPPEAAVTEFGLSWPSEINPGQGLSVGGLLVYPDGSLASEIVWKQEPAQTEIALFALGRQAGPVLYDTPIGSMAVLLGEDAWLPGATGLCSGAELIVSPSLRWAGDHRHEWAEKGINSMIHRTSAKSGMTLFNRCGLFERKSIGEPILALNGNYTTLAHSGREEPESTVIGLWL